MSKFLNKSMVFGLLLLFILIMNVGAVVSAEMMMEEDGMMHNCPFMGLAAVCQMSPLTHLALWQQMFSTTLQEIATVLLLLLLALAITRYVFERLFKPRRAEKRIDRYRYGESIFDPLQLALARGIIHSKSF